MDNADRWYFTKDQLANTPSRKCGISEARELSYRQQAANFIQDMGQRLQVNQLCINTAIVYMHRFYVFHSFTEIHRNKLSLSALFLAAKVEEQPRKLEHLIKVAHACLHKDVPALDVRSEAYQEKMFEVVAHENILLQTLGFVLGIEHPHTYVVKVCQLVKASKDLAQTSYIMATTSLHMTTMCLMYKPTLVACVCIHLACKWSDWRIEPCSEGRDWFFYVDRTVTNETLESLTDKFIAIMETSPHRFKKKFGQKDINLHGPRNLIEDSSSNKTGDELTTNKTVDEPSTSRGGTSYESNCVNKEEISSPSLPSGTYDFADFEERSLFKEKSPAKAASQPLTSAVQPSSTMQPSAKPSTPVQPSSIVAPPNCLHPKKQVKVETSHSISLDVYREKREKALQQNKVAAASRVASPPPQPQVSKKPQHAFRENERVPHRTSSKHIVKDSSKSAIIDKDINYRGSHHMKEEPLASKASSSSENKFFVKQEPLTPPPSGPPYNFVETEIKKEKSPVRSSGLSCEFAEIEIKKEKSPVKLSQCAAIPAELSSTLQSCATNSSTSIQPSLHVTQPPLNPKKSVKTEMPSDSHAEKKGKERHPKISATESPSVHSHKPQHALVERGSHRTSKHSDKHKKHSSKEKLVTNHLDRAPSTGIKVKIPKTVINLTGKVPESSQKYPSPDSPKKSLKIKIQRPVESVPSDPLRLVITKDKGSYSASQKNERNKESRKRVHSNSGGNGKTTYDTPSKYQKRDHSQKSHHSNVSGGSKSSKSSKHSSHRNATEHSFNDGYGALQHPANGNNASNSLNAQYPQGFTYKTSHLSPSKLKGYNMPIGETNSVLPKPPLPPPLSIKPQPPLPPE